MLLDELKSLLQKHNLWAKKRLGQNFLVDEQILCSIIESAELKSSDNVIEVGPGTGFLTEKLVKNAGNVIAIERDVGMIQVLKEEFSDAENLKIIQSDILDLSVDQMDGWILNQVQDDKLGGGSAKKGSPFRGLGGAYKVVANIPYYITSPLLKHFLQSDNRPEMMVLLVQKEVAEKICGITGKSVITIETQLFGEPEIIDFVPAECFHPAPKVTSAILKIKVHKSPLVPSDQLKDFLRIVKFGFSQKRKKLKSSLSAGLHLKPSEVREVLIKLNIDPDFRAENLDIEDWKRLTTALKHVK